MSGAQTYGSRRRQRTSSILSQIEGRILVKSTRTHSLRKTLSHDFRQKTDPKPQWTYTDSKLKPSSERLKQVTARRNSEEDGRIFFAEENAKLSAKHQVVELDPVTEKKQAFSSSMLNILGPKPREEIVKLPPKKRPMSARKMPDLSPRGPEPKATWSHILRTALNKRDPPPLDLALPGHHRKRSPSHSPRGGSKSPKGSKGKSPRGKSGSRSPRGKSPRGHKSPRGSRSPGASPRSPRNMYSFDNYTLPHFMLKQRMVEVVQPEDLPAELLLQMATTEGGHE